MSLPSTHVHVPAGHGRTFEVRSGQFITVIDRDGQQAADFVAIVNGQPDQYLSPTHTRRTSRLAVLQRRRQPVLERR